MTSQSLCSTELDRKFGEKLQTILEKQLDNPEFTIEDFASAVGVSRAAFFRKVKGVTGYTPNEYMRILRMKRAMELLQEGRQFTAIAGQNDMMAIGALDALHEAKVHVPRDVSVIGCDNIFYSGIRRISLTTIDHFVALKGQDACDIIIRKIDAKEQFLTDTAPISLYNIEYTPKLMARRTTGYAHVRNNPLEKNN